MTSRLALVLAVAAFGLGLFPALAVAQRAVPGTWLASETTNPLDDSRTVVARLAASEGAGGLVDERPVTLFVRCRSNTTEAYVVWHDYLGLDDTRVTYRFPPADAQTVTWSLSTDNVATFVRGAIPFLRTLVQSERLVMQTTPYNESPTTAIFDLGDAEAAVAPIAEECGWILDADEARRVRAARQAAAERDAAEALEQRMAEVVDQSFPLGNIYSVVGVGDDAYATRGLPEGVSRIWFPGVTVNQLLALKAAGAELYSCPVAEEDDGSRNAIVLKGCAVTEESLRALEESRLLAEREAEEARRAAVTALEARMAELVGESFPLGNIFGLARVGDDPFAARGLPDGVSRVWFSGVTLDELISFKEAGVELYTCTEAEPAASGKTIELKGCVLEGVVP